MSQSALSPRLPLRVPLLKLGLPLHALTARLRWSVLHVDSVYFPDFSAAESPPAATRLAPSLLHRAVRWSLNLRAERVTCVVSVSERSLERPQRLCYVDFSHWIELSTERVVAHRRHRLRLGRQFALRQASTILMSAILFAVSGDLVLAPSALPPRLHCHRVLPRPCRSCRSLARLLQPCFPPYCHPSSCSSSSSIWRLPLGV